MKVKGSAIVPVLLILIASCTGKNSSPKPAQAVLTSFETQYGKEQGVQWELSGDTISMASFKYDGHPVKAYFEKKGNWLKSETELSSSEIPEVVIKTVVNAYRGSSIYRTLQVDESGKGRTYRLSLKSGRQVSLVCFSSDGVIVADTITR
jgi:hypothetical protein